MVFVCCVVFFGGGVGGGGGRGAIHCISSCFNDTAFMINLASLG